ncbi:baeRF2 domain-containing protein [Nakamurella alba]|nr:hypothetical protein [Nakamurella alba]
MLEEYVGPVLKARGPFVSVSLDVGRTDEAGAREVEHRWQAQRKLLAAAGAPDDLLETVGSAVIAPPGRSGQAGRVVVANADGVLLDVVHPGRPVRDESTWSGVPQLLPLVRGVQGRATHLLVAADKAGADLEMVGVLDNRLADQEVEGSNDELHRVPGGRMSQRRVQARVEDSVAHNAKEVAKEIDVLVRRFRPDVVLVDGEDAVVGEIRKAVEGGTRELLVHLSTGGRADGTSERARAEAVDGALADFDARRAQAVLDRFSEQEGSQGAAVQGLDAVVDVLRKEQLDTLLLADDPTSTLTLWTGPDPSVVGLDAAELASLGVTEPHQVRADAALIWSTLGSGGAVQLYDRETVQFTGGVAAVLRWSDRSTPRDGLESMPGHGQVQGRHRRDEEG